MSEVFIRSDSAADNYYRKPHAGHSVDIMLYNVRAAVAGDTHESCCIRTLPLYAGRRRTNPQIRLCDTVRECKFARSPQRICRWLQR